MMKLFTFFIILSFISQICFANEPPLVGWHWYNEPKNETDKDKKIKIKQNILIFSQLSPSKQLKILKEATENLKAKSILSGKVGDIAAYKRAQDFWVSKATQFTIGWERMLLQNPELNYSLKFSHENAMAPVMQKEMHDREKRAVSALSKNNGFIFFYRGKNKGDRMFSTILSRYSKKYHFPLIPVSVDGVLSPAFHNSQQLQEMGKASALGVRYFPALVLVNPLKQQHEIVSYGFKSEDELSNRLLKIADGWKAEF